MELCYKLGGRGLGDRVPVGAELPLYTAHTISGVLPLAGSFGTTGFHGDKTAEG
jgi:hypothetical protein